MSVFRFELPDEALEAIARRAAELVEQRQGAAPGPRAEELVTAAEAGRMLGVGERYVWRLGREGLLPRVKVGAKYVRFRRADVVSYGERARAGSAATARNARARKSERARPAPGERLRFGSVDRESG